MSNPWDNDPVVTAPAAPARNPWDNDPVVSAATPGVPPRAAAPVAPPAAPSVLDKVRNGISAGLNLASDTVDSITGMAGHGAGLLGGLAGALGVKLSGGVQPDDPRVVAAGTGPARGADARPLAAGGAGTGEAAVPQTALDEAGQQGAQAVTGAVHQAAGLASRVADPTGASAQVQSAVQTPGGRELANDVEAPGGLMAHIDPQIAMTMHAPAGAAADAGAAVGSAARAAGDVAGKTVKRASAAVGDAAATGAAKAITKVLPAADPELVKVAQLADQFPHPMQIMPDRLLPEGAAKTVAQDVSEAPMTGGSQIEHANAQAFTKNVIDQLDEGSTADRLNATTLNDALEKQGAKIGAGYDQAGAIPAAEVQAAMEKQLAHSTANGAGDVPRLIQNRFTEILGKADADGNIPPQALREWDSDVGRQARTMTDDEAAGHLSDLQSDVRDLVESKLSPDQAAVVKDARRRYAYGMVLEPSVGAAGKGSSVVGLNGLVEPGKLINPMTSSRAGRSFMARGRAGPMGDLARVGQLMDNTAAPDVGAAALAHGAMKVAGAGTGVSSIAGKVYNKAAPRVTRMLAPKVEKPAVEPPAPPPELELAEPGALPSRAVAPAEPGPLGDLTPDWETAPGAQQSHAEPAPPPNPVAAVLRRPERAPTPELPPLDGADLYHALGDDAVTTGNPAPPSAGAPGSQIPAVPGRPDLPDTMVSGRPGETAASDAANVAMHDPGAIAARAAQESAAKGAADADAETSAAEAKKAAAPKPTPEEQTRLDEIDKTLAGTQSDIVRETLEKARAQVMKDVTARDTVEKTKAAAAELRAAAQSISDPVTQKTMLAKADKLDPPAPPAPPAPKPKPAETPLPSIEYADTPEWRQAHGLGPEDAQRAVLTRRAYDLDPDAVDAAAVQHASAPRAFDRVVDKILEKQNANEAKPAAGSGQGPESPAPSIDSPQAASPTGGKPTASGRVDGDAGQPGGTDVVDPHEEAARQAKFHLDHPRDPDGKFTEK